MEAEPFRPGANNTETVSAHNNICTLIGNIQILLRFPIGNIFQI